MASVVMAGLMQGIGYGVQCSFTLAWLPIALTCDLLLLGLERGLGIRPPLSTAMTLAAGHVVFAVAAASLVSVEGTATAAAGIYSPGNVSGIMNATIHLEHSVGSALICLGQGCLLTILSSLVLVSRIFALTLGVAIHTPKIFIFIFLMALGFWTQAEA